MGDKLSSSEFYKSLEAIYIYFSEQSLQTIQRVKQLSEHEIADIYKDIANSKDFEQFINLLQELNTHNNTKEIIDKEIYHTQKSHEMLSNLSISNSIWYLLNRLKSMSIDDVGGGKIKVIGVLESRGTNYDGIIIADFNENIVPKQSKKDIFLNSKVKLSTGLPTTKDREDLQKFYYYDLIHNT